MIFMCFCGIGIIAFLFYQKMDTQKGTRDIVINKGETRTNYDTFV